MLAWRRTWATSDSPAPARNISVAAVWRRQWAVTSDRPARVAAARTIAYMFYGMLRRAPRPWMFASAHLPFLWGSFFAAQRGDSSYVREVRRAGPLASAAAALLRRGDARARPR